jgi:hypothetical protein
LAPVRGRTGQHHEITEKRAQCRAIRRRQVFDTDRQDHIVKLADGTRKTARPLPAEITPDGGQVA